MSTIQYVQTVNVNLGVLTLGLLVSAVGPTLMDLAEIYGTSMREISHLLTSRAIGLLVGSIAGGKVFAHLNGQLVITLSLIGMGVSMLATPLCPELISAHAFSAIGGIGVALFEVGSNVWLVRLWAEDSSRPLQMYQLSFGLGAVVAPFMAEPFLSKRATQEDSVTGNFTSVLVRESRVHIPYAIIGACFLAVAVLALISYGVDSKDIPAEEDNELTDDSGATSDRKFDMWIIFLLGMYIFFDITVEACFSGMITTFAVHSKLQFSKGLASYLTGAFWAAFTLGRVVGIVSSYCISLTRILISSHVVLVGSATVLVFLGEVSPTLLWGATFGLGLGMSALYGSSVAWTVQYVRLQHEHMGFVMITSCFASMSPPFLLGSSIESHPMSLMYWTAALVIAFTVNLLIMLVSVRGRPKLASNGAENASFEKVPISELNL